MDGNLKIGTVEAVNGRRVKVRLRGSRTALAELTVLRSGAAATRLAGEDPHSHSIGAWVPSIGDKVVCILIQEGSGQGFVIGAI